MIIFAKDMINNQLADFILSLKDSYGELSSFERECLIEASKRIIYLDTVSERIQKMIEQLERKNNVHS